MPSKDVTLLRDLAQQYREIAQAPIQEERRNLWRKHNSLKWTKPLIYVRAWAWEEMPEAQCLCEDRFYRHYEDFFRQSLFRHTFQDDYILEPWVTVNAAVVTPPAGLWGLPVEWTSSDEPRGARKWKPPLQHPEDFARMVRPHHVINEEATAQRLARLHDAIGDLITINLDRGPVYRMWNADLSTELAKLRGLDQMMWDMMDRPEWLHEVLAFMRDGVLEAQEEAEKAGDWSLSAHQNQAIPYAEELADPAANSGPVTRNQLWVFCASQETTLVGPAMFNEFMLQYQRPIIEKFGLAAYGCCEDLTLKIPLLKQIPNMRRIAVALTANVPRCAEQIGADYVLSYRPSPADMVAYGFDPDRIRGILRRDLAACKECHTDVTLKDVETVQGDPDRVRRWVEITRSVIDEVWG